MSIRGDIEYASNLAAGVQADAAAIGQLLAALGALQGAGGGAFEASAAGAEKMALAAQKAADASDLVAQKTQAAAELLAQKGAQDQALAAQEIAAAAASDQLSAAMQREALAAANAAQQNDALAKLVLQQAKSTADLAAIEAKGEQDRLTAAQNASDKLIQIKTQEEAKLAAIAQKEAADSKGGGSDTVESSIADLFGSDGIQGFIKQAVEDPIGTAIELVVGAITALVSATSDLLEAGSKIAVDAGAFRESTVGTFAAMLHSEAQANDLYDKLIKLADKTGQSKEALEKKVAKELGAGATEKEALAAIEASATIAKAVSEQAGNKLAMLLSKVEAGDKFDTRTVSGLKAVGINVNDVYDQLAQTLGKTRKEVELLTKQGKVTAAEGAAAIEAVVAKTFGKAADAAEHTIPALVQRIKDEFTNLFDSVNVEPLRKILDSVVGMIEGPQGAKAKAAITAVFGNLFEALFGGFDAAQGANIFDKIVGGVQRFADFIHDITPGVQGFIHGVIAGFSQWLGPMGGVARAFLAIVGAVGGSKGIWEEVGRGIGFMAGFLVTLAEVVLALVGVVIGAASLIGGIFFGILGLWSEALSAIYDFFASISDTITGSGDTLTADAGSVGGNIMDGLVGGVESKAAAVAAAVVGAASNAIAAAKKILGIASRSKVFFGIGGYSAQGMAEGFDAGADDVVTSARSMAKDAAGAAAAMGPLAGPSVAMGKGAHGAAGAHGGAGAAAGGGIHVAAGGIVINVGKGASSEAGGDASLAAMIEARVLAVLTQIGEGT